MANLPSLFRPGSLWSRRESPFQELNRLQRQMDRMFDEVSNYWPEESRFFGTTPVAGFAPACDVEDTDTHTLLSFDLPGMKKEDIRIEMFENELRVSGERQEEHEEKSRTRTQVERFRGNFYRSFTLPAGIKAEQIETEYADGVLRIAIPHVEAVLGKPIAIGQGKPGFFQKLLSGKKEESKKVA